MWFRRKTSKKPSRRPTASPLGPDTITRIQRVRLPVDLLASGMRVVKLDRPWTEVPVLFQGFTIETPDQARILRQYCEWVLVEGDDEILSTALNQVALHKQRTSRPMSETRPLSKEIPRARKAWTNTQTFVEQVTRNIEQGNDLNLQEARPVIRECVASIKANASAMLWMSRIKSRDAYTAEHCLRVAIFTVAFARFLGMPDEDLEIAGLCGLLHDLGKLKVPAEILNKPGALTREEFAIMRKHTTFGYELLRADTTLDPIIRDVTRHHHERIDGSGYPQQLQEWQISRFARLVSIVDAFDAMTSDRCYRDGIPTSDAIRILYRNRGRQFDADMVEAFIRMVGIYPPGTLVELTTGEVALIVAAHPGKKLKPRVEVLLDTEKKAITPRMIDLANPAPGEQPEITRPLPDGAFGISLQARIHQLVTDHRVYTSQ
ncbi:MAG: HD-GYP domain-containing protein [Marinobacter sp.]|uniref:HD-GYP domain-containing protein n=1 Tax=Marinobacter sp. TaxID=50741 RepID=UPI003299CE26